MGIDCDEGREREKEREERGRGRGGLLLCLRDTLPPYLRGS